MKPALIIGAAALAACAIGVSLSALVFRGGDAASDLPAPPPAETFAAVFEPCAHCHQIGDGARPSTGPELNGIIGTEAATGDYPYSEALRASGIVWNEETLRAFLLSPTSLVPGTRMRFVGMDPAELDALMDFLAAPTAD